VFLANVKVDSHITVITIESLKSETFVTILLGQSLTGPAKNAEMRLNPVDFQNLDAKSSRRSRLFSKLDSVLVGGLITPQSNQVHNVRGVIYWFPKHRLTPLAALGVLER